MRYNVAFEHQSARAPSATGASAAPFYPDDLLPALQSALAMLADLEVQFEIARDSLEEWCGSEEDKQRCCAELEHAHRQAREAHLQRVAQLEERIRGVRVSHSLPPLRDAA
jgi:hypothetical protein